MIQLQDFVTFFLSIVLESLPFVIIGIVVSIGIALFVSEDLIVKVLPKNKLLSLLFLSLLGVFAPVCQCGNIPVARRLMLQGLSISQATTFLLAAPIVNPLTFITTYQAFPENHALAIVRIISGFFIANVIGLYLSFQKNSERFLTKGFYEEVCSREQVHKSKVSLGLSIFSQEFMTVMKLLCLG